MHVLETVLLMMMSILGVRLLLISDVVAKIPKHLLIIATLLLLTLNLVVSGIRWQLFPAHAALALLLLIAMMRERAHLGWRVVSGSACGVLILASAFLAQQLPVLQWPKPEGPFAVGTFSYAMTDESRSEVFEPLSNAKRVVSAEVWYPAVLDRQTDSHPARAVWSELYQGPWDWAAFFTAYLGKIETHSYIHAPIARSAQRFPVLLFNSGLYGWSSQSTLLMEHLASHGYIVFSISHPHEQLKVQIDGSQTVLPKFSGPPNHIALSPEALKDYQATSVEMVTLPNREQRFELATTYMTLFDKLETLRTPHEQIEFIRADLQRPDVISVARQKDPKVVYHFHLGWNNQSEILSRWVADTMFIANQLGTLRSPVPNFKESIDAEQLGILGHSFGGATAGEVCKMDSRCKAGVNMDGEQFGQHWQTPLKAPFAMLYGTSWIGFNDFAYGSRRDDFLEYTVAGAHHMDFSDVPVVIPLLKQLSSDNRMLVGPIQARRMNEVLNSSVLAFFDRYLKGKPIESEFAVRFPELIVSHPTTAASQQHRSAM